MSGACDRVDAARRRLALCVHASACLVIVVFVLDLLSFEIILLLDKQQETLKSFFQRLNVDFQSLVKFFILIFHMKINYFAIKSGFCSPSQVLHDELKKATSMSEVDVTFSAEEEIEEQNYPPFFHRHEDISGIDDIIAMYKGKELESVSTLIFQR